MDWQSKLIEGVAGYLQEATRYGVLKQNSEHIQNTPKRVVRALLEKISGVDEDPVKVLMDSVFDSKADAMVHIEKIQIHSTCAHHLMPIIGIAHFAYIPNGRIIGLSKIPRFIDILCRRLQVQEELCQQIVDVFDHTVHPDGCAVWMKAFHCCMSSRGVYEHRANTKVLVVRGAFRTSEKARLELMASVDQNCQIIV